MKRGTAIPCQTTTGLLIIIQQEKIVDVIGQDKEPLCQPLLVKGNQSIPSLGSSLETSRTSSGSSTLGKKWIIHKSYHPLPLESGNPSGPDGIRLRRDLVDERRSPPGRMLDLGLTVVEAGFPLSPVVDLDEHLVGDGLGEGLVGALAEDHPHHALGVDRHGADRPTIHVHQRRLLLRLGDAEKVHVVRLERHCCSPLWRSFATLYRSMERRFGNYACLLCRRQKNIIVIFLAVKRLTYNQ